jgi:hypothetical protein
MCNATPGDRGIYRNNYREHYKRVFRHRLGLIRDAFDAAIKFLNCRDYIMKTEAIPNSLISYRPSIIPNTSLNSMRH